MASRLPPGKIEEMVKKAPNKIVDDKLHSKVCYKNSKEKLSACSWFKVTMIIS